MFTLCGTLSVEAALHDFVVVANINKSIKFQF